MAYLPVDMCSVAIKSIVGEILPQTIVLQHIQHTCHLAEDEDSRPLLLETREELVQDAHLPAVDHQVSVRGEGGTYTDAMHACMSHGGPDLTRFCTVKQIRVVATFPELHEDIEKSHLTGLTSAIHNVNVLHQNLGIPVADCEVRFVPCPGSGWANHSLCILESPT